MFWQLQLASVLFSSFFLECSKCGNESHRIFINASLDCQLLYVEWVHGHFHKRICLDCQLLYVEWVQSWPELHCYDRTFLEFGCTQICPCTRNHQQVHRSAEMFSVRPQVYLRFRISEAVRFNGCEDSLQIAISYQQSPAGFLSRNEAKRIKLWCSQIFVQKKSEKSSVRCFSFYKSLFLHFYFFKTI